MSRCIDRIAQPNPLCRHFRPSGVGKDSALKRMKEMNYPFHFVVTTTDPTATPREVDGWTIASSRPAV